MKKKSPCNFDLQVELFIYLFFIFIKKGDFIKCGDIFMNNLFKFMFLPLCIVALVSSLAIAQENKTTNEAFRVGPTVSLRPLDSEINKSQDGIVELFLNNPSLNDVTLECDLAVNVPSDIYIYSQEGGMAGGAGTVTGHFSAPPGSSRTITLHIQGKKVGAFSVHFSGNYWPGTNKDAWNPINLDNSFKVIEASEKIGKSPSSYEFPYSYIFGGILGGITAFSGIISIYRHVRGTD